jgi:hypothetical protein
VDVVKAACGMLSDDQFRQLLGVCRFAGEGQRPGFVPFNAGCLIAHLALGLGVTRGEAERELKRRARVLGGEVVEGEVLWLPAHEFGQL